MANGSGTQTRSQSPVDGGGWQEERPGQSFAPSPPATPAPSPSQPSAADGGGWQEMKPGARHTDDVPRYSVDVTGEPVPLTPLGQAAEYFKTLGLDLAQIPMGLYHAVTTSPVETAKNIGSIVQGLAQAQWREFPLNPQSVAVQRAQEGRYSEALGHGLAGLLPVVDPAAAEAGEEIGRGETGKGLAHATELIAPSLPRVIPGWQQGAIRRGLSAKLRGGAEEQYAQVLHPSEKAAKFVTQERLLNQKLGGRKSPTGRLLTPQGQDLLERRVMGWTMKGLRDKLVANRRAAGQAVRDAYDALPPTAQTNIGPMLNTLYDHMVEEASSEIGPHQIPTPGLGNRRITNPELWDAYTKIQADIIDRLGPTSNLVSTKSLAAVRRDYDRMVKNLFRGGTPGNPQEIATFRATNSIRDVLNGQNPSIARVNAEFSFWKDASDVMSQTVLRKVGQQKFLAMMRKLAPRGARVGGALLGFEAGGAGGLIAGELVGGAIGNKLDEIMASTAWKTVNAVTKNEIAKAIVNRRADLALKIASRAVQGTGAVRAAQEQQSEEQRTPRTGVGLFTPSGKAVGGAAR